MSRDNMVGGLRFRESQIYNLSWNDIIICIVWTLATTILLHQQYVEMF